jgi:hypothetical protein
MLILPSELQQTLIILYLRQQKLGIHAESPASPASMKKSIKILMSGMDICSRLKSAAPFEAVCQVVLKKRENFARIQMIDLLKYGTGENNYALLR